MQTAYGACLGVLGIPFSCHFTSRDMEYYPFNCQGYVFNLFLFFSGILDI